MQIGDFSINLNIIQETLLATALIIVCHLNLSLLIICCSCRQNPMTVNSVSHLNCCCPPFSTSVNLAKHDCFSNPSSAYIITSREQSALFSSRINSSLPCYSGNYLQIHSSFFLFYSQRLPLEELLL